MKIIRRSFTVPAPLTVESGLKAPGTTEMPGENPPNCRPQKPVRRHGRLSRALHAPSQLFRSPISRAYGRLLIAVRAGTLLGLIAVDAAAAKPSVAITPVPSQASLRIAAVQVRVVPDHLDWTYHVGEPVNFRISITADGGPIGDASVTYAVAPDMIPGQPVNAMVPPDGLLIDGGTMREPGFLRCTVTAIVAGRTWKGVATAAFEPEKIVPFQTEPKDFDEFWRSQLATLALVPLEPRLTLLPDACTDKVDVYHVSFRTVGEGWNQRASRVYGILCEPKAPGKYPVILKVPGAGVRPYFGDKTLAAKGAITLEIGVHGMPVNLQPAFYDMMQAGPLNGYPLFNLDHKEKYYYRRVYLSCVRANDFLVSRPMWDGRNLLVMGASQGGLLSIVTAALDSRVTALACTHPAFCDVAAELHGRAGGWPHPFAPDWAKGTPSKQATPAKIETATYYDAVNFARRIKVPGFYTWGYNDDVCPPTSVYAAYNVIVAPKTLGLTLELAHDYTREQQDAVNGWVQEFLGLKEKNRAISRP